MSTWWSAARSWPAWNGSSSPAGTWPRARAPLPSSTATRGWTPAVGVHPHDAAKVDEAAWATIVGWAADPRVVAIGETGSRLRPRIQPDPGPAHQPAPQPAARARDRQAGDPALPVGRRRARRAGRPGRRAPRGRDRRSSLGGGLRRAAVRRSSTPTPGRSTTPGSSSTSGWRSASPASSSGAVRRRRRPRPRSLPLIG